jgi:hypothetical protein
MRQKSFGKFLCNLRRAVYLSGINHKKQYMQTIKSFDKANLADVRKAIDEALEKVAQQFGLESVKMLNIKFSGGEFRSTIEAKVKAENNPAVQERQVMISRIIGYNKNIIGQTFNRDGKTFKVVDIETNRPKFPIVCADVKTGEQFKFTNHSRLPIADESIKWEKPTVNF